MTYRLTFEGECEIILYRVYSVVYIYVLLVVSIRSIFFVESSITIIRVFFYTDVGVLFFFLFFNIHSRILLLIKI